MKRYFLLAMLTACVLGLSAGNGNGKNNGKNHDKHEKAKHDDDHDDDDDDDRYDKDKGKDKVKASKNIPNKVRKAFDEDFPNARNTTWTKSRGDWTARFKTNFAWRTATYHANGDRISTGQSRFPDQYPTRSDKPGKDSDEDVTIIDKMRKRWPGIPR